MNIRRTPSVSVVMPVYNGEASVEAAIRSVQGQSLEDWELVIYDDGSRDDSLAVCRQIAAQDSRIRVVAGGANRGLAAAMNRLMDEATAELIAVQEQDDESVPDRLAREIELLASDPKIGMVSGVAEWMSDGEPVTVFPGRLAAGIPYPEAMVEYLVVEQCKVVNACVMFRRECLPIGRAPFDEEAQTSIDWQFFIDVAHHFRIVGIPEVLVRMDRSPLRDSVTSDKKLQGTEARRCLRVVRQRYRADPESPVNWRMLRRAWATQLNLEGRWREGARGVPFVALACCLDPLRPELHASLRDFVRRGLRKARATMARRFRTA